MAASVATARRQSEDKPLDLPLIGEARRSQPAVKPSDAEWVLPLIGQAIDRVMQRKEAAILMGIDQGQMTRQLGGEGHLSALRLGALPPMFWVALIDELRGHFGLDDKGDRVRQTTEMVSRGLAMLATEVGR